MNYRTHFSTRETPQSQATPSTDQVQNNAGGFAWAVDDWARLDRFLILGSEGGTYYVKAQELTIRNAEAVARCIKVDGPRVVARVVEISCSGRAPKNDPALFVLAMCAGMGDGATRSVALGALSEVARIGTHLFHFAHYVEGFRGWGRSLREAVAAWYNGKEPKRLAYQVAKYQQRDGWSHRDLLRLSHPKPVDEVHNLIYKWVTQGPWEGAEVPALLLAAHAVQSCENESQVIHMIQNYGLTHEMIPTQFLKSPRVWGALLEKMPLTAMIRNLGRMSAIDLLTPMSGAAQVVCERLGDVDRIHKARVHPYAVLLALRTYQKGSGFRGGLEWDPVSQVVDALDGAFYLAFDNVEPVGKRVILALDVSSSMGWSMIGNGPLTAAEGAAAMALVTARTEPLHAIMAFARTFKPLEISPRERLDDVLRKTRDVNFGGTDCALPMIWALNKKIYSEGFVVYTDNETWAGNIHPSQALRKYREQMGTPAKLAVVGMTSGGFSIADPNDAGMMDFVGYDASAPVILADFLRS